MRNVSDKFVGTTQECFAHLFAGRKQRERYALYQTIAEFCNVQSEAVSRWQRGRQLIRGSSLVRLRCFLHLAGYEVAEVDGYRESVRSLLLLTGVPLLDPEAGEQEMYYLQPTLIEARLGYTGERNNGLYRIILRNEGYSHEVGANMLALNQEYEDQLADSLRYWREWIKRNLQTSRTRVAKKTPALAAVSPTPTEPDPQLVASFTRSVGLTLSLGNMLAGNSSAVKAIHAATRSGMDLQELRALLDKLLP